MLLSLFVCACVCGVGFAAPTQEPGSDETFAMDYFKRYGFVGPDNPMFGEMTDAQAFPMAILEFQTMYGLERSGELDGPTMKLMNTPRCGMKDIMGMNDMTKRRKKRYALQGSMWSKGTITWRISKYTPDMSRADVDKEVERAWAVWSMVANLNFQRVNSGAVDIDIAFVERVHGDGFDFDGQGGTLAHAFFPQFGGDVHMDEDERWTINTFDGVNLFQVIAHEFGHSLGLSHSTIQEALMAPFYRGYQPDFMLHQDDVAGIQAIYGPRTQTTTTTTTRRPPLPPTLTPAPPTVPPVDPEVPRPCKDGRFDAILYTEEDVTYAFREDYYLVIDRYGIAPGYPRRISDDWPNLPSNIDAALTIPSKYGYEFDSQTYQWRRVKYLDEKMYFLKGNLVYQYTKARTLVPGYPQSISEQFPGLPDNIDAAFVWGGNGKAYFFKGDQYYRYESGRIYRHSDGRYYEGPGYVPYRYPESISIWRGVPSNLDAVFKWRNGRTYFFKGDQYYRFHDRTAQVDPEGNYPRSTRSAWLACTSNVEDDRSTTTMMMEADMEDMGMPKFDVVGHANNETEITNGQSPLSYSLLSFVSVVIAMVVLH